MPFVTVASQGSGKVVDYWVHNTSDGFAFSLEAQTGRPSCASFGATGRYVVDIRSPRERMAIAPIMAAKASGANVTAQGAGICSFYGDSEDLQWAGVY